MAQQYYYLPSDPTSDAWVVLHTATALTYRGGRILIAAGDTASIKVPKRFVTLLNQGLDETGAASAAALTMRFGEPAGVTNAPSADLAWTENAAHRGTIPLLSGASWVLAPSDEQSDDRILNVFNAGAGKQQLVVQINQARA